MRSGATKKIAENGNSGQRECEVNMPLFLFWMSLQENVGFNVVWSLPYNQQKHQSSTVRKNDDIEHH